MSRKKVRVGGIYLNQREIQILQLLVAGETNRGISRATGLTLKSVEHILSNASDDRRALYPKLGVTSRTQAAAWYSQNVSNTPDPAPALDLQFLGLSHLKEPDRLLVDTTHRFSLIEQTYLVEGFDGKYVLRYQGANASPALSYSLRDRYAGDSPVDDIALMRVRVMDKERNSLLPWKLLQDEPYAKLIELLFHRPLGTRDSFDVEFSCRWPGTFTRREDYVFFPMHYFQLGVEKLVGRLILDDEPGYIVGMRLVGETSEAEPRQPSLDEREGKFVVSWEIDNPQHIYVLRFSRGDL